MAQLHDQYGKTVLRTAFPLEFDARPVRVHFDTDLRDAGTSTIDGVIGSDIAVEVESRASKQVRGALVDLAFHPHTKKLMVLIQKYGNSYTASQCRAILKRLCAECQFEVVEIAGSGDEPVRHLEADAQKVRDAVERLRRPNQTPEPTRASAGLRIKPESRVAHL